jgi:hypothetical protein
MAFDHAGPSGYSTAMGADDPLSWVYSSSHQRAAYVGAAQGYKLACAPDRATLCAGKSGDSALRCVGYHRLRLSSPCKHAMDNLALAQQGAL